MAGMIWNVNTRGGYMWTANLSRKLRTAMQPMQRFRALCDAVDGTEKKRHNLFSISISSYGDRHRNHLDPRADQRFLQQAVTAVECVKVGTHGDPETIAGFSLGTR